MEKCKACGIGFMAEPENGMDSYVICNECKAIRLTYTPMLHQAAFHADKAKFKMYAGGYGSGKTVTAVAEVIKHVLSTPRGATLMTAPTIPQLEQTSMKELFEKLPPELIEHHNKQKGILDLVNGHRILFRASNDEQNLRSLNLSCFHIEEANGVDYNVFTQLTTRLRSNATKNHLGILSSNPDIGWIKNEFLLKSGTIVGATEKYVIDPLTVNPDYSTHIAATELNKHLPPDYRDSTARGKPQWWIARYLNGSFSFSDNMVYPNFAENVIDPIELKPNWERIVACDFGLRDPHVFLAAAIDHEEGVVYVYDEHYEANRPVSYHANVFKEMTKNIPAGMLRQPVADPSGKQRSKNDMRSLFNHYAEYGIYFKPANNRILDGVQKVYNYLALGKLKVFNTCVNTVREGVAYKYKVAELDSDKNLDETPVGKDDHTQDTLRYLLSELPDSPEQLKNESVNPLQVIVSGQKQQDLPFALQTDEDSYDFDWYNYT